MLKLDTEFDSKIKKHLSKSFSEVGSTLLKEYLFIDEENTLVIKFHNSDDIYYYNVPPSVFKSFLMSESKGSFFARKIKKSYPWRKIDSNDIVQKAQPLSREGEQLAWEFFGP